MYIKKISGVYIITALDKKGQHNIKQKFSPI